MQQFPTFIYPWHDLEDFIKSQSNGNLNLLAYGSLMNSQSAARTLVGHSKMKAKAIIGSGIRRIFNYRMTESAYKRYGKPISPKNIAALNVITTNSADDKVNGILQEVAIDDLGRFREREVGYCLTPIEVIECETLKKLDLPVYTLEYTEPCEEILPHLYYLEVCSEGALSISQEFLEIFYDTTYLWDNKTKLKFWLTEIRKLHTNLHSNKNTNIE